MITLRGAEIVVAPGEDAPTLRAADVLANDMELMLGVRPAVRTGRPEKRSAIWIASAGNARAKPELRRLRVDTGEIAGKWESYLFSNAGHTVVICGADPQATLRAVYAFGRDVLGVDPFCRWHGLRPERRSRIDLGSIERTVPSPAFRFRGWFLNHDTLIRWNLGRKHPYDPEKKYGGLGGQKYIYGTFCKELTDMICETALRSDMNFMIPLSYLEIFDDDERAVADDVSSWGLYMSFHHQEPLGANLSYWNRFWLKRGRRVPEMSLYKEPKAFDTWWRAYAQAWARYERVLWVIGHRGPGDRPFWLADKSCPPDDATRGKIISRAMEMQVQAIRDASGDRQIHRCATLWQEGSPLHKAGHLKFPDGSIIVMADHGAKQLMRDDFYQVKRLAGLRYGVYYHTCYYPGGPLSTQGNSPDRMWYALRQVIDRGDTEVALLNAGVIRPFYPGLDCWSRITTAPSGFEPEHFLHGWCAKRFGESMAAEIVECYNSYFHGCISPWYRGYDGSRGFWDGVLSFEILNICRMIRHGDLDDGYRIFVNSTFPDAWNYLSFQRSKSAAVLDVWDALCSRLHRIRPRIQARSKALFDDNLLLQAELMRGLSHGLHDAASAAISLKDGNRALTVRQLAAAAKVLRMAQTAAHRFGNTGIFKGWFDDKITCIDPRVPADLSRFVGGRLPPAKLIWLDRQLATQSESDANLAAAPRRITGASRKEGN